MRPSCGSSVARSLSTKSSSVSLRLHAALGKVVSLRNICQHNHDISHCRSLNLADQYVRRMQVAHQLYASAQSMPACVRHQEAAHYRWRA